MNNRRNFLKSLTALTAGICMSNRAHAEPESQKDRLGELLPTRKLGRTGEWVTMLGVGGYHFGTGSEREAQILMESALEGGVRFFDCAVEYQNGGSEKRMGKLLTPNYRDVIFLMTKSDAKTAKGAQKQLDDSLRRMNTDYLDLWQVHAVGSPADVDNRIESGVFEVFQKAKESGKVRHIGFTGHRIPSAHLHVLEKTQDNDIFETCQMPVNLVDSHYNSFIKNVLPALVKRNIGVLAMKTLSFGNFFTKTVEGSAETIIPDKVNIAEALHFVWSLPVSVLITGARNSEEIQEKIRLAKLFKELNKEERQQLITKVSNFAGNKVEWYKA